MSRTFGDRRREGTILASSKLLTASAGLLSASSSWGRVRVPWSRRPLRLISALITRPRLLPTRPGFRRRSSPGSIGRSAVGATARPGGALKGDRAPLLGLPLLPARSVPPARWGPPRPGCRPPKLAAPTGAVPLLFAPRLRLDRLSTGEATLSARTTFAAPSAGSRPDRDDPAPGLVAPSFALPRRLAPADRPCVTRTRSPYRDGLVPAPDAPAPPAVPLPSSASPAPSGRSLPASTPRPPRGGPIGHCTRNLFDWSPRAARHRNTFCPGALRNEGLPSCPTAPFSLRRPRLHLPATPQGNGFGITRRPRRSIPGREPISALITPTRADGPSRSERRPVPISALITPVLRPTPSLDRLHRPRTAAAPPCADCPGRRLPVLLSCPVAAVARSLPGNRLTPRSTLTVGRGIDSAPKPEARPLPQPAWSPLSVGRKTPHASRRLSEPIAPKLPHIPRPLADRRRIRSGSGGNRRDLFLPQPRRQPSPLRRCPSPCAHPRGSDRDRRRSADAPRHPSLLPRSPDSTPCRKSARFREPFTPSVAPRRSRFPGRHGSGPAHRGGLHTPANPDRWSTAPVAPGAFPPVPRGPRAAPRSRREAEKTGAVVGAERREQGCDRSKGDARGLENCRRLETSPDPRYQYTDDPRRPPPPGTDDLDGEPPVRARPHGRGPRPPRSLDEAPRVSHRSHFRAAREALGGLRCPSRRRSRSRTTGRSPSRRPKRVPVTDGSALRRARPAARGEGACPRPVGTPRPRAASRGSLTRMHLSDIADRRGPGSPLRSVALASTRPAP